LTLGPVISSTADERSPCGVCKPKVSGFHFCRHLVDPENRLYRLFTAADQGMYWDHSKTMQALDAYADFLTLKLLEKEYSEENDEEDEDEYDEDNDKGYEGTMLLPPDVVKDVRGGVSTARWRLSNERWRLRMW
jgi:hypothetical protein